MPEPHPLFQAPVELGAEIAQRLKDSREVKGPDFGMEQVSREEWRQRVRTDEAFRRQQFEALGRDKFLSRYAKVGKG